MRLSVAAKAELMKILCQEFGEEFLAKLTDEAIHDLGTRLLLLTAAALRRKQRAI